MRGYSQCIFATPQDFCSGAECDYQVEADIYSKRKHDYFLTRSLNMNRMKNATLKALLFAVEYSMETGKMALRIQKRALGKDKMHACHLY